MQSSPEHPGPGVSTELARLESQLGQTADQWARARLAELGDAAAARVLRAVAETGTRTRVRSLSAFINHLAKQEAMQRNAAGIPTAESAACCNGPFARASQEDSISGPFYEDNVQMEVQNQSPNGEMAFAGSNHARMEPGSPVRQMPFRSQYHKSPVMTNACVVPDRVEMEVEIQPGLDSPDLQNQFPFSAVDSPIANPGGMGAGCLGYHMPDSPGQPEDRTSTRGSKLYKAFEFTAHGLLRVRNLEQIWKEVYTSIG